MPSDELKAEEEAAQAAQAAIDAARRPSEEAALKANVGHGADDAEAFAEPESKPEPEPKPKARPASRAKPAAKRSSTKR